MASEWLCALWWTGDLTRLYLCLHDGSWDVSSPHEHEFSQAGLEHGRMDEFAWLFSGNTLYICLIIPDAEQHIHTQNHIHSHSRNRKSWDGCPGLHWDPAQTHWSRPESAEQASGRPSEQLTYVWMLWYLWSPGHTCSKCAYMWIPWAGSDSSGTTQAFAHCLNSSMESP